MDNYIVDKLSSISEKLGNIDTKIEYLITDIYIFKQHIKQFEYNLKNIIKEIDSLKIYNNAQDEKIELLQYQVSEIEDRFYKLSRYIDKLSYREKLKLKIYLNIKNIVTSKPFKFILSTIITALFLSFLIFSVEYITHYYNIDTKFINIFKELLK